MKDKVLEKRQRVNILGTPIDKLNQAETVKLVDEYVQNKIPLHLMGVNADKINSLNNNQRLKNIVRDCGIINADGASVVLASKFLGSPLPERVAGIDLMDKLVQLSERKHYSIYLLGAKQGIVEGTAEKLLVQYPKLNIVGTHNGYFFDDEWGQIAARIKAVSPDFVFVGITSPKKEYLIEFMQKKGLNCIFMGVGGSFDVISGMIPRAPKLMQRLNLEWLFRVVQEPKRLFKRYFVGNNVFLYNVVRQKIRQKKI